jgi:O-methyltransferase involved in polyketide biosynthesis
MAEKAGKVKVTLTGVTETLLIPLVGRAMDATTRSPILGDRYAKEVMEKLDYDFGKLPMPPTHAAGVALRTRFYDRWTAGFLATHPRSTVLHLACGLDSRHRRVDWGDDVLWIDVDLPEVVALRRQVLSDSLPGRGYRLIEADITQDTWIDSIPTETDRPILVVMEGLLSYLQPDEGKHVLGQIVRRFSEGELHFDCMSSKTLSASRQHADKTAVSQTGSVFKWGIDDLKDIEEIHPRLRLLESIRYLEAPGVEQFPFFSRAAFYLMSWVPSLRDSVRFVRFGFSDKART